ncbi:hypothetical protein NRB56_18690 [Nocardia sp. RB56]|uniref:Uncharacterized protein n=1 Tax=Nocardia aurantia TaxID=2585199 RepID=A0A7K0DKJ7_9NOCA|nr:hypothetical protein [Nocardia aurantia]
MRDTRSRVLQPAFLGEDARLQKRFHQRQNVFVSDTPAHPLHQSGVVDLVETRLDVAFDDPVIIPGPGRQIAHFSHSVPRPAVGPETIRARQEIRLEDRLQHQLQRCLDHPVGHGRDPQPAQLATGFRDHPLTHRHRAEAALLHLRTQLAEEVPDPLEHRDGQGCSPIHPGSPGTGVPAHPIPRHHQERRITHEVEQIIEPATRIAAGPTVQLRLDIQYPSASLQQHHLRIVGIHRRHTFLLIFQSMKPLVSLTPFALRPLLAASTAGRHSRDYYGASAPPLRSSTGTSLPIPPGSAIRNEIHGPARWFPRSPGNRSVREAPSSTPAAPPRLRRRPSPWPPHRTRYTVSEPKPLELESSEHCTPAHIRQVGAGFAVTELRPLVRSRCTF